MKLRCKIEPSDYVRAQYLHLRPRPVIRWLGILLVALSLLVLCQQIFIPPEGTISALPFILFAVLAYLVIVYGAWLPYRTKKIYKQQKTLQEAFDSELTEEEFISTTSFGSTRLKWRDFYKYKVGKDMILVYQSDAIFHMFPRRWFPDGEYDRLIEILRSMLGDPKT